MPLPFDPAGLPLMLGMLPHTDARAALAVARQHAGSLLAWPQLPQRSFREHAVAQSARGFPGLVLDETRNRVYVDRERAERELDRLALAYLENNTHYARLPTADAAGFSELIEHDYERSGVRALKGQLLGPISLAAQLTDEKQQPLIYDAMLFDAIVQHVRLRANWQEARLGELIGATLICIEEPFLELVGQPFLPLDWEQVHARLDEAFGGLNGGRALYAGGALDWAEAFNTAADMVIGDVYDHGARLVLAAEPLAEFLATDGLIGFGLVPADAGALADTTATVLFAHLQQLLEQLAAGGVEIEMLARQSVVTTSAGLGLLDVASAERALQLTAEVSALLREQYALA